MCKEDVKTRCLKAAQVFYHLSPILGHKEISMITKTQIIKAVFTRTLPGMRIFSGSAKSRGFCLTRTDLVNRPDPLRYFWTNIGGWGSLFPMINSSESAYFVA